MNSTVRGLVNVLGRVALAMIFLLSAVGNKIPQFQTATQYMEKAGVPAAPVMLSGAIVFLIVGSVSLIVGYRARFGAALLLIFLALATYFFHNFWDYADPQERQGQLIQFMKNLALMGAMLMVIANGAGPWSLDAWRSPAATR